MVCKRPSVLIIDDEEGICEFVREGLAEEGYVCDVALNADDALAMLKGHDFDVALLDIILPKVSGIDLLKTIKKCYQMTAVVMITGVKDLDTAIETMKLGASDYIIKPFTLDKINASISAILKSGEPHRAVRNTIPGIGYADYSENVSGRSLSEIDAIAYGVDAQVDDFDFHSKMVTEKTVELARWLGLSEEEIEKWATARDELYFERDRRIKSMLSKLERNPMAQVMLGLTRLIWQSTKSGEEQN